MSSTRSAGKKSTVRNRRERERKTEAVDTHSHAHEGDTRDDVRKKLEGDLPGSPIAWTFKLRCRYWAGFLLGAVACAGTYWTYERDDEWKALKFIFWLAVSLVGLYLNESRPGKKYFYTQDGRVMHM